jgi:hypothetical protein
VPEKALGGRGWGLFVSGTAPITRHKGKNKVAYYNIYIHVRIKKTFVQIITVDRVVMNVLNSNRSKHDCSGFNTHYLRIDHA